MIYYCSKCNVYFHGVSMTTDPDGEPVHYGCFEDGYVELTETEIVDALNDKEIR